MTSTRIHTVTLQNVRVPISLLAHPERFGGQRKGPYLEGDLICAYGQPKRLNPSTGRVPPRLLLPKFTDPHVHLDKCHSVDRIPSVGGDLLAAIEAQRKDKTLWTEEDLRRRASRGLEELIAAGCRSVRSHVDWPHGSDARNPPVAWYVLKELAATYRDQIDLQLAPLTTFADLHDPDVAAALGTLIADAGGALGCFFHSQPDRSEGIKAAFDIARTFDLPLDFHVDEGLTPGLNGLDMIAREALDNGFTNPILCGHTCSLMNLTGDVLEKQIARVAEANLFVAALPSTNLYLQGRTDGTPDRRGVTRMRELQAAGVAVVVGADNVRDAFCPIGQHDPRATLALAILAGHLDPPLADLWPMISTEAARAIGRAPNYVDTADLGELILLDVPSSSEALMGGAAVRSQPVLDACKSA